MDKKETELFSQERIDDIKKDLKNRNHQFVFSNKYNIHSPFHSHTAIRFAYLDGEKVQSPFHPEFKTELSEWKNSKSVSCESGLYAIPFEHYDSDNLYERLMISEWYVLNRTPIWTLLEYSNEDIIYKRFIDGLINEICLRRANIIYTATLRDYVDNSEDALDDFKTDLYKKYLKL